MSKSKITHRELAQYVVDEADAAVRERRTDRNKCLALKHIAAERERLGDAWSFLPTDAEIMRSRQAQQKARAIIRGVRARPDGFLFGLEVDDAFNVFIASVFHRMTQLGFEPWEIESAFDVAWKAERPGPEWTGYPVSLEWGRA